MSKSGGSSYPVENAARSQIQQDWANREYVEVITTSIKRITDFLNSFGKLLLYCSRFVGLPIIIVYDRPIHERVYVYR